MPSWTNFNGADCSQIAYGGVVIAWPTYTWSLEQCSDDSEGAPTYCGQVFWFYEDDTGDTTDDLIATTEVKQGTNIILYVVTNFGPGADTPGDNVIWLDSAFGTQGQTGKGNGWCAGTKAVCVAPVAGPATVTNTTQLGKSKITTKFTIDLSE